MELPRDFTVEHLDELQIAGSHGRIAARLGLMMTLYLQGSAEPWRRQALGRLCAGHLDEHADHLTWMLPPKQRRRINLRRKPMPNIAEYAAGLEPVQEFSFEALGGDNNQEDASHYSIGAWSPSSVFTDQIGHVTLGLPFAWAAAHPGAFPELVLTWCRELQPWHGYAGLGILMHPNYGVSRPQEHLVYPLVARFPGLEFDRPVSHGRICVDGIKGVNWLTVVGDGLLAKVGGLNQARVGLADSKVVVHDYPGGAVFQAGPVPQIGDNDRGLIPPSYRAVSQFLKPIRADYDDILMDTPRGIDRDAFARRWFARFD